MKHPERLFFLLVLILCALGLLFVFNASVAEAFSQFGDKYYFVRKQAIWLVIGLVAFVATSLVPVWIWKKLGGLIFLVSLGMLVLILIPGLGKSVQGAQRWIEFAGFTFQPSEFVKLGVVLYFPLWLTKHQRPLPFMLITGLLLGLLLLQPDMGTAMVVSGIAFSLFVAAGAQFKHILGLLLLGVVGILALVLISPYRLERLTTFLRMEQDPLGTSYHIRQITIALGSGGWFGQGLGQSKQKYLYIPEASTDSIFAIAAEELGFIGSCVVLALYAVLLRQAFGIVDRTEDPQTKLLAIGVTSWIGTQMLLNLASVVALVPLTGVPLPFISYGGSSLLFVLAGSGILIAVGRSKT